MKSHSFASLVSIVGVGVGVGCGGDNGNNPPPPVDTAPMPDQTPDTPFDEGGGTTLEYQTILDAAAPGGMRVQARVYSYYLKDLVTGIAATPGRYPLVAIPGCAKTGQDTPAVASDDVFPFGFAADHTYQDVGTIQLSGGASPVDIPLGPNPGTDGEHRQQDGVWHFLVDANGGTTFLDKNDAPYSLAFGGAADWPAQTYPDAFYMPPAFTLNDFAPRQLVADTDFVSTWVPPTPQNQPVESIIAFVNVFSVAGVPVLMCIEDNLSVGQSTVPKELVNYVRSIGAAGTMTSVLLTHRTRELTDGTHHNHKRMDFIAKWGYVTPWTAP